MKIVKLGILAFTLLLSGILSAQSINSPYSNHQLGEFVFQGLPHNYSMGQVGIGTPTPWHINLQNPAFLTYNKLSSFQVGVQSDYRRYTSDLDKSRSQSGSLRYLALSFPVVNNRWTTAVAVLPLTTMKYNTLSTELVDPEDSVQKVIDYKGDGGLTQIQWANGIRLFKSLTIGVKASYIFGTLEKVSNIYVSSTDITSNYAISYFEDSKYSDLNLSVGASYRARIGEKSRVTMGLVHGLSKKIEGTMDTGVERITATGASLGVQNLTTGAVTKFDLPNYYGVGVSYELLNKLKAGVDFTFHNWESTESSSGEEVRNTISLGTGLEFIPEYTSVKSFLKRTAYRLGFSMTQLPYLENDTEINDFGINFGAAFPVSGYSSVDVAFKYGYRGTTNNDLVRENYFQAVIGATINDRWFIKRRYD